MHRIKALDSFRFLAITLVALFHYFSRWTQPIFAGNYYPYGGNYKNTLFDNGYLGVQFFFIISGFVIYFTLERSKTIKDFLLRRLVRLYPTLLICSVITFIVDNYFFKGVFFHHSPWSFVFSLTFLDPVLLNNFFHFSFPNFVLLVDSSYWSLVIEVKFYLLIALLYFATADKAKFLRNYLVFFLLISIGDYFSDRFLLGLGRFQWVFDGLLITKYQLFFTYGILLYSLFSKKVEWSSLFRRPQAESLLFLLSFAYIATRLCSTLSTLILFATASVLFFLMIYKPQWLRFLDAPLLSRIGFISYSVYLLHQQIGVELINFLISALHIRTVQFMVPIIVYGLIILAAEAISRYFEKPAKTWLYGLFGLNGSRPVFGVPAIHPVK